MVAFLLTKALTNGGATFNLMHVGVMENIRKADEDSVPHNLLITNFNGKSSKSKGIITINIQVDTITQNTMFVVVPSKANFKLLLGIEWIHVVGVVPSTLHQKMFVWNDLNVFQVIEVDPTTFNTPDAKILNTDKIWVDVGPFKIEEGIDFKRHFNERGEPLTMVLRPRVGF